MIRPSAVTTGVAEGLTGSPQIGLVAKPGGGPMARVGGGLVRVGGPAAAAREDPDPAPCPAPTVVRADWVLAGRFWPADRSVVDVLDPQPLATSATAVSSRMPAPATAVGRTHRRDRSPVDASAGFPP